MKRLFLSVLVVMVALLPIRIAAQQFVLQEGFENGIPADWTQTNETSAVGLWQTESDPGLLYPSGVYSGKSRAVLRNTTGETQGYKTRLITPMLDLDTIYQPLLRFAHAQVKWTADFDTLRVFYKNSTDERATWKLLAEYTYAMPFWTREEISLPDVSSTYWIAFEGSDNLGRGIVLDSIVVRSKPDCTTPHHLATSAMYDGGVDISWLGSYDANGFEIIYSQGDALSLDTVDIDDPTYIKGRFEVGSGIFRYRLKGLESQTKYTAYIRSLCDNEVSMWSEIEFYMQDTKAVPYYESFDLPRRGGYFDRLKGWSYGTNTGFYNPCINTNQTNAQAKPYVMSGTAMCFTGRNSIGETLLDANSLPTWLKGGQWAYAATPELYCDSTFSLKDCQVRFFASLGNNGCLSTEERAIIVGVMTDPEDITTFTSVDTVRMWKYGCYEEYEVSLEKYQGDGKYVAFLSRFDKPNMLYIDDMNIEKRPAIQKASGVKLVLENNVPTLTWNNLSTSYKVIVASVLTYDVDNINPDYVLATYTPSVNKQAIGDMEEGVLAYAYVRGEGAENGLWSNGYEFYVPIHATAPWHIGFEPGEGESQRMNQRNNKTYIYPNSLQIFSTDPELPHIDKTGNNRGTSRGHLELTMDRDREAWVVLPVIDNFKDLEIEFFIRTTDEKSYGQVSVGVMTDPQDMTTFEKVATFYSNQTSYERCLAVFDQYKGNGKYIAIRWEQLEQNLGKDAVLIDDISVREKGECNIPMNVRAENLQPHSFVINWDESGAPDYDVVVALDNIEEEVLNAFEVVDQNLFVYTGKSVKPFIPMNDLKWGKQFHIYVRSVCDREREGGMSGWAHGSVITPLPERIPLPYSENFDESEVTGEGTRPFGWIQLVNEKNPYIYAVATYSHTQPNCLYMQNYATASSLNGAGYLVLPRMEIDNIQDLLFSFYAKAMNPPTEYKKSVTHYVDTLYIGFMTDPNDLGTYQKYKDLQIPSTSPVPYNVTFEDWEPSLGEYIVLTTRRPYTTNDRGITSIYNSLYLDDFYFSSMDEARPFNFVTDTISSSNAVIRWSGRASKGWQMIVSDMSIPLDSLSKTAYMTSISSHILENKEVTELPVEILNLQPQVTYYIYVRPVAAPANVWGEHAISTPCLNVKPGKGYFEGFEMGRDTIMPSGTGIQTLYTPMCWTAYNTNPYAGTSYIPGIYWYSLTANINNNSFCHGGRAAMMISSANNNVQGGLSYLVSPFIDVADMKTLTITFWAKAQSAGSKIALGVMTDPTDTATCVPLAEAVAGDNGWHKYTIELLDSDYKQGQGNYLYFTPALAPNTYQKWYIDDVKISENICANPRIVYSGVSHSSITVMTSLPRNLTVEMLLVDMESIDEERINNADSSWYIPAIKTKIVERKILENSRAVTLTGLKADNKYTIAMRNICESESSTWVISNFRTLCTPITPEALGTIDFEDYESSTATPVSTTTNIPCFIVGNKTSETSYIPYVFKGTCAPAGAQSLRIKSSSLVNGAYAISPRLDIDDITKYELHFKGRANAQDAQTLSYLTTAYEGAIIVGVVTDPSDMSTFIAVDTISDDDILVHDYIVSFSSYIGDADGEKGKHFAFLSEFSRDNLYYIDDVSLHLADEFQAPNAIRCNATEKEADITWRSTASKFKVCISNELVPEGGRLGYGDYVYSADVTGKKVHVTGLKGAHHYYLYVGAVKGDEVVWNTSPVKFMTDCPEYLEAPYYENFDTYRHGTYCHPACWTTFYNAMKDDEAQFPYTMASANLAGPTEGTGLYMYVVSNTNTPALRATIALPKLKDNIKNLMIAFDYKANNANNDGGLIIGLASDISNIDSLISTFVGIDTLFDRNNTEWKHYSGHYENYSYENMHLILASYMPTSTTNPFYIDNFVIDILPTCFQPAGPTVENVKEETATISFKPYINTDTHWDIQIITEDGKDTIFTEYYDKTTLEVNTLKPGTDYVVSLRTNCGNGDVSSWSTATKFSTKNVITGSAFYGFELSERMTRHEGAGTAANYQYPTDFEVGNIGLSMTVEYTMKPSAYQNAGTSFHAKTGSGALRFYNKPPYKSAYAILPYIENASSKQISFDMRPGQIEMRGSGGISDSGSADKPTLDLNGKGVIDDARMYKSDMEIGYVERDKGITTFVKLTEFKPSMPQAGDSTFARNYDFWTHIVMQLPDLEGKQLAFRLKNNFNECYMNIDNLAISPAVGYTTPQIKGASVTPTSITVRWDANGESEWNVYLVSGEISPDKVNYPLDSIDASTLVQVKSNVTATEVTFENLIPNRKYCVYLQLARVHEMGASSPWRVIRTPSFGKLSTSQPIGFETNLTPRFPKTNTAAELTGYLTISGYYFGNKETNQHQYGGYIVPDGLNYQNANVQAGTKEAHSGTHAVRLFNNNSMLGYTGSYMVLPAIDCDRMDTLQINFWARPFSEAANGNVTIATSMASIRPLKVGLVSDPNDISTFEPIAEFIYSNSSITTTTKVVPSDPVNKLFEQYSFGVNNADGKYIAFLNDTLGYWCIDDITFTARTCLPPLKATTEDITQSGANLTWVPYKEGAPVRVQVATLDGFLDKDIVVDELVTDANNLVVTGLDSKTDYYWRARQECGEDDYSAWSRVIGFMTECPVTVPGRVFTFESDQGHYEMPGNMSSTIYYIPQCWTNGTTNFEANSTYFSTPRIETSSGNNWYSHDDGSTSSVSALRMNNYATPNMQQYTKGWAIMPRVEEDMDTLQLVFYGLPAIYNHNTEYITTPYVSQNYAHAMTIGTVTDPNDITTFEPIQTVQYDRDTLISNTTQANAGNDYMFQKFVVPLRGAKGKYIVFMNDIDYYISQLPELQAVRKINPSATIYNIMFIDNVMVQYVNTCPALSKFEVQDLTTNSAKLTWTPTEGAIEWDVVISSNSAQTSESILLETTVTSPELQLDNLQPSTEYFFTVVQHCDDGEQSYPSQVQSFRTLRVPLWTEDFFESTLLDWTKFSFSAKEMFSGNAFVPTKEYQWAHTQSSYGIQGHHYVAQLYGYSSVTNPQYNYFKDAWLITPEIVLDDEHDAWLTFNAALTKYRSTAAADLNGWDDQFMVIVSDDAGKTWKRENAIIWNNETGSESGSNIKYGKGDFVLNSLPRLADENNPIRIDLSKYKGKHIKIAFYAESSEFNAINELHLGNIRVNYYVIHEANIENCQFEELPKESTYGFELNEDKVKPGVYHFEKLVMASVARQHENPEVSLIDSIYRLDANILEAPLTNINAVICEGREYNEGGFEARKVAGVYKKKFENASASGCDSIVVLNLDVTPTIRAEVYDTICAGRSYVFNETEYTTRTIAEATFTSNVTLCDSVVTLYLEVTPLEQKVLDVQICTGSSYNFTPKYPALNQTGTYIDTIPSIVGCDTIVTLNLLVTDVIRTTVDAVLCKGEQFEFAGQTYSEPGTYEIPLKAVAGCDSIVTLVLTESAAVVDTIRAFTCVGAGYHRNGFDVSEPGTYTYSGKTEAGCDSTVVLILTELENNELHIDTTILASQLPFFSPYAGKITYPMGTTPGEYRDTVKTNYDECEITIFHRLYILDDTSVDNYSATGQLNITPTLIERNQTVTVNGSFSTDDLKNMRVEIFDVAGRLVSTPAVGKTPIVIGGFRESGIYSVRLTTGTGRILVGRVLVE